MSRKFAQKLQSAREMRELNRVLRNASPAMHQEILAAAARQRSSMN